MQSHPHWSSSHPDLEDPPRFWEPEFWDVDSGPARGEFSAPVDGATRGRLEFKGGMADLSLRAEPGLPALYTAYFEGIVPQIWSRHGDVAVRYRHTFGEWLKHAFTFGGNSGEMTLNADLPWEVTIRGGISDVVADLSALSGLRSIEIGGGLSDVRIRLPKTSQRVPIRIRGGCSDVSILRPTETAARLSIRGGAADLAFDGKRFGAIGGRIALDSPRPGTGGCYELEISGGVSDVEIGVG